MMERVKSDCASCRVNPSANWPDPIDRNCIFELFLLLKCTINCNKSYKKWKCSILIFSSLTQSATCLLKYFLCVPHKPQSKYLTWRFGSRCWTSEQIPEHRSETCAMCGEQIIILIDGYTVIKSIITENQSGWKVMKLEGSVASGRWQAVRVWRS